MRARLDQARDQRGQRHDRGDLADGVAAPVPVPRGRGDPAAGEPPGEQADRDVDREHQPPARGRGQRAAQDRSRGGGQPADPAPQADGAGPPGPVRVAGLQQREGAGYQQRRGRALDEPDEDQDADRRGQRAAGRGGREQDQPGQEHPPRPEPVSGHPGRQQQRREGQCVAVDHPLQPGDPAAQVLAERGQGQVHRGGVEDDHEIAERDGQQRHPGRTARRGRAGSRGPGEGFMRPVSSGRCPGGRCSYGRCPCGRCSCRRGPCGAVCPPDRSVRAEASRC